ncbi:hypothetical protein HYT84_02380 [Candidatus Micrarchaeota archaeon]|nr:hypothetical protein [Candidatus Micrarchaeota archaeon]
MQLIYIYDIKGKDRRDFNRIKRMFYYRLVKLNMMGCVWKTRSVLLVPQKMEQLLDDFFKSFSNNIEVYKIKTKQIESLNEK